MYQGYVDSDIRPKLKKMKKPFEIKETRSAITMSPEQLRERGLKNLEIAKKLKMNEEQLTLRNKSQSMNLLPANKTGGSYIDYLKEMKRPNRENQTQKEFKDIVKNRKSLSDFEQANKAFYLAEKMSANSKKLKDAKMYNSAKNKL